jgi:hypothetical protein
MQLQIGILNISYVGLKERIRSSNPPPPFNPSLSSPCHLDYYCGVWRISLPKLQTYRQIDRRQTELRSLAIC